MANTKKNEIHKKLLDVPKGLYLTIQKAAISEDLSVNRYMIRLLKKGLKAENKI